MNPSEKCFELIRFFEASNVCRLKAYLDTGGVPTIGWGTTMYPSGKRVKMGDTCTKEQADLYLQNDVKMSVSGVLSSVKVQISQAMFDALVSFVYNLGIGQFRSSTLLKRINEGSFELASQEFRRWRFDNGVEQAGLLKRRMAEKKLFDDGVADLKKMRAKNDLASVAASSPASETPEVPQETPVKPSAPASSSEQPISPEQIAEAVKLAETFSSLIKFKKNQKK